MDCTRSSRAGGASVGLLDSVAVGGVLLGAGFVGYEYVKNRLNPAGTQGNQPGNPAYSAGYGAGTQAGSAAIGAVNGAINAVLLGGQNICDVITYWRGRGAPANIPLQGIPLLGGITIGGGDPSSWANFRTYATDVYFVDPGPTPPACF